jgi:hypothetical protein
MNLNSPGSARKTRAASSRDPSTENRDQSYESAHLESPYQANKKSEEMIMTLENPFSIQFQQDVKEISCHRESKGRTEDVVERPIFRDSTANQCDGRG